MAEAGFAYADRMRAAFKEWWEAHLRAGGYSPLDSIANHRIKTAFYAGVSAANRPSLPEAVAGNASAPVGEKRQPSEEEFAGIKQGLADVAAGRVKPLEQIKAELAGQPSGVGEPLPKKIANEIVALLARNNILCGAFWQQIHDIIAAEPVAPREVGEGLREALDEMRKEAKQLIDRSEVLANNGEAHRSDLSLARGREIEGVVARLAALAAPAPKPAPPAEPAEKKS